MKRLFTKQAFLIASFIFLLVGAGLSFIGSYMLYKEVMFDRLDTKVETEGTVVEFWGQRATIEFTDINGDIHRFTQNYESDTEDFQIGEKIELVYDSEKPDKVKINTFVGRWILPAVFIPIGFPFLIIGIFIFVRQIRNKEMVDWLKINGKKIEADFIGVALNGSININGENPFVIKAQWQDPLTEKLYVFKSESLWFDPTDFIKNDKIDVLIHPQNPKKYWIDISFLPEVEN